MISADLLTKIILGSFPVIVIVTVAVYVFVKLGKEKKHTTDNTPPMLYGRRYPTEAEAGNIKAYLLPKHIKAAVIISLIFLPVDVIIAGVAISIYDTEGLMVSIIMGFVALAFFVLYIGIILPTITRIRSLKNRFYTVCDCYVANIHTYWRTTHRGVPVKIRHAVIRDQIDLAWETDLPKYLHWIREGSKCLVIIYDEEEKINKARSDGRSIYTRDIYVPDDER